MRSGILIIVVSLIISACGYRPAPQTGCNFVQNSMQQRVSWNNELPIPFYVHESVPSQYHEAITSAMRRWEDKTGRKLFNLVGVLNGANAPKRDGISAIYWMEDWESEKPNEQARTTIYWDGTQIREADIRVNEKNFDYSVGQALAGYVDLESLLVHELGHVLGLQHNDANGSVMAVNLANGTLRRVPGEADLASLKCEY